MQKRKNTKELSYYMTLVYEVTSTEVEPYEFHWSERKPRVLTYNIQYLKKQSFSKDGYGDVKVSKEIYEAEKVYAVIVYFTEYDTYSSTRGNIKLDSIHLTKELAFKKAEEVEVDKEWKYWGVSLESIEIHEFSPIEESPSQTKFKFIRH
jgi:hypothetical protein